MPLLRAKLFNLTVLFIVSLYASGQSPIKHGATVRFMSASQGTGGSGEQFRPAVGQPGMWPSVLIVPDKSGLTDDLRLEAARLSAEGYLVLVMDPYDGIAKPDVESASWTSASSHDKNVERIEYALTYLESWMMDSTKLALIGWGAGGTLASDVALQESNVKVLGLHDGVPPIGASSVGRLKAAAFCSYSGKGGPVDPDAVASFAAEMRKQHRTVDSKVYPDAAPGFEWVSSSTYNEAAAKDAQNREVAFLAKYLRGRS